MKKIKVSEATGPALDWMVARCEGWDSYDVHSNGQLELERTSDGGHCWLRCFTPSTDWSQGGPIIEREKLELRPGLYYSKLWACWGQTQRGERLSQQGKTGPTPLIAAMRCYVASKLGDKVEVPEELV